MTAASATSDTVSRPRRPLPFVVGDAQRLRRAVLAILIGTTVLQRFGLNFSSYPADFGLLIVYATLPYFLWCGAVRIEPTRVALVAALGVVALSSFVVNLGEASLTSLLLLFANYLPFTVVADERVRRYLPWSTIGETFSTLLLFIALAGIIQFGLQFVFSPDWLFDFTRYVPEFLQNDFGYNTVIPIRNFVKSNGFFLREPSIFSQLMAFGLVLEYGTARRPTRMTALLLGLLLSYSGTGLLVMASGLLVSLRRNSIPLLVMTGLLLLALSLVLGDVLQLSLTLDRLSEFSHDDSSAYVRFVAPARLLADKFAAESWTPFIGHGPGTVLRMITGYDFFDPTWVRMILEYGIFGTLVIMALLLHALWFSAAPLGLRMGMLFGWLFAGENLMTTQTNMLMFAVFTLWPARRGEAPRHG